MTASVNVVKGDRGDPEVIIRAAATVSSISSDVMPNGPKLLFGDEFQVLLDTVGQERKKGVFQKSTAISTSMDRWGSKHRRGSNDESTQRKKKTACLGIPPP